MTILLATTESPHPNGAEPVRYAKLQYIHKLSPSLTKLFSNYNVIVANYNAKKLNLFYSNLKDKTLTPQKSGIVYGIPCECGCYCI